MFEYFQYKICIQVLRSEVETKDSKIRSLSNEIDELQNNSVNEEEVKRLKRQKQDLDGRLKDQVNYHFQNKNIVWLQSI